MFGTNAVEMPDGKGVRRVDGEQSCLCRTEGDGVVTAGTVAHAEVRQRKGWNGCAKNPGILAIHVARPLKCRVRCGLLARGIKFHAGEAEKMVRILLEVCLDRLGAE